jgi:hypothetical protein
LWIKKHHINYQDPSLGDAIDEFEALYFLELQNHVFIYGTYIGKKFPEVPDSYERSLRSWPDIYAHPGLADALEYGGKCTSTASTREEEGSQEGGHRTEANMSKMIGECDTTFTPSPS